MRKIEIQRCVTRWRTENRRIALDLYIGSVRNGQSGVISNTCGEPTPPIDRLCQLQKLEKNRSPCFYTITKNALLILEYARVSGYFSNKLSTYIEWFCDRFIFSQSRVRRFVRKMKSALMKLGNFDEPRSPVAIRSPGNIYANYWR